MTTQSYEEVLQDESYNEGFDKAAKQAEKKYNKLFEASKAWFLIYESAFGVPDENDNYEYWQLRKLLKINS